MKYKILYISMLLLINFCATAKQQTFVLKSPDQQLTITINTGDRLCYSVCHNGTTILADSPIAMTLENGTVLGKDMKKVKASRREVRQSLKAAFYKRSVINDDFNEIVLTVAKRCKVIFRAYNEGVAYRFLTEMSEDIIVKSEMVNFNFDKDYQVRIPYVNTREENIDNIENQCFNSFENVYTPTSLSKMAGNRLVFLPCLVELDDGKKLVITEADLEDYPGMMLRNANGVHALCSYHAPYPKTEEQGGYNNLQYLVTSREDYIARTKGIRAFPWRCLIISERDADLADSDMVYQLAAPSRVGDSSWIKPGKVAWDWWNAWGLRNTDFEPGVNDATYEYYIDFASRYGIEYVILDEGWAVNKQADLFQVVPEIHLSHLVDYAKTRNVGLVLWAGYAAMEKDMEKVCRHYSNMGIRGFKVDFMDRDDQKMVNFYYRMAETAARYHLFVDFHGAYKPTGMNRTYPNVLNVEGVFGLEQVKWNNDCDLVTYETLLPFIRMVAGPMDFTQGAMKNASQTHFKADYSAPMSQGTRCRQLAEYVVFEAPFSMLCDSPSNYMEEEECTQLIARLPTTWDETVVLDGKAGEYVVVARKKDFRWYIGAITNWTERDLVLDLTPLKGGAKSGRIFRDGPKANENAQDYISETTQVMGNQVKVHLAKGGGMLLIW